MEDELILSDQLAIHTDRKKLDKLVAEGKVTKEELENAPIYIECPHCKFIANAFNDVCPNCEKDYDD